MQSYLLRRAYIALISRSYMQKTNHKFKPILLIHRFDKRFSLHIEQDCTFSDLKQFVFSTNLFL